MKKQQIYQISLFYLALFVFFVIFYTNIHPIVPYSSDDWENLYRIRPPFPSLHCWNPTKIFPECFEPVVGSLSAFFLRPITGDYLDALILGNALTVALFIIVYLGSVHKLLVEKYRLGTLCSGMLILIFVLFHFVLLRSRYYDNEYLWYAHDANCYYHYVIPNMLCATLVLWLMRHEVSGIRSVRTWACLIFSTYFALCSNLYSTIILTAYIGSVLCLNLRTIDRHHLKDSLIVYIRKNAFFLTVLVLWGIVQWMESCGLRANAFGYMHSEWWPALKATLLKFYWIRYNSSLLVLATILLISAKVYDWRILHRSFLHINSLTIVLLFSTVLSSVYLILLSSKVFPYYIERGSVIFGFSFFTLLLVLLALAYLCKHVAQTKVVLPFMLFFLFSWANTNENTYKDVLEDFGPNVQSCINIDRRIIREIQSADVAGLDTVTVKVPTYTFYDNNTPLWGPSIAVALEKHNVISREIIVKFEPGTPVFGKH